MRPYLVHVDARTIEPIGYGKAEVEYTLVTFEYERDRVVLGSIGRRRAIVVLRIVMIAVASHGFIVENRRVLMLIAGRTIATVRVAYRLERSTVCRRRSKAGRGSADQHRARRINRDRNRM